ncbi:MAG: hypothetical protein C4311_10515 [Chloroflexota bacterium]
MYPTSLEKLDELIGLLRLRPGARVIEIASGKSEFMVRLAERDGISGIGVDISFIPFISKSRIRCMTTIQRLVSLLVLTAFVLSACATPAPTSPATITPPAAAATPVSPAATAAPPRSPILPTATVPPTHTPGGAGLPEIDAFPLPADLYFIAPDASGEPRVWRLPYTGGLPTEVTPPGQPISDFAVAPDRRTLAYRTGQIAVAAYPSGGALVDDQAPMPAEGAPPDSIAWSPDGTKLAYSLGPKLRIHRAGRDAPAEVSVPLGGAQLGRLGWSPDSRWLAALAAIPANGARPQLVLVDAEAESPAAVLLQQYYDYLWLSDGTLWGTRAERQRERFAPGPNPQPVPLQNQPLIGLASPRDDGRVAFMDFGLAPMDEFGILSSMNLDGSDLRVEGERAVLLTGTIFAPGGRRLLVRVPGQGLRITDAQSGANAPIPGAEKATLARFAPPPLPQVRDIAGLGLPADLYFLAGPENGPAQVWRWPKDDGPPIQLTQEPGGIVDFAVSPDGTQIAYTAGNELIVARADGGERRILARLSSQAPYRPISAQPAWSPDGTEVAYVQDGIWVVPAAGGEPRQLVADQRPAQQVNTVLYLRPAWSPDSRWLLVWEQHWEGNTWALVSLAGGAPVTVPDSSVPEARWTPDSRILLASAGGAYTTPGLHLATPGNPPQVTRLLGEQWPVQAARLQEDGRIAFLAAPGLNMFVPVFRLYTVNPDGSDVRLANDPALILYAPLAWSPDGRIVASIDPAACCPARGALTLTYLETGQQVQLAEPGNTMLVAWGQ